MGGMRRLQLQLLPLMGFLPALLDFACVPVSLTDAVHHGLTRPGAPRIVCGAIRVMCGLRIAAGNQSVRSSDAGSPRAAAPANTLFLQTGEHGFQWRS